MSARDCTFLFEVLGFEVRETPYLILGGEVVGFLLRTGPGERDIILTSDAAPIAKGWTRLTTRGPRCAVTPLVLRSEPRG